MSAHETFERLRGHCREAAILEAVSELLGWDERCMLPPAAGEHRAEQMTLLAAMLHDRKTDPRVGEWLGELSTSELAADRHTDEGATIFWLRRQFDRAARLPKRLVEELARTSVLAQQVWQEARSQNDFASYRPLLEQMIALKREEAEAVGYDESPYDALLDDYEPNELASRLSIVLGGLRDELVPLVAEIGQARRRPDTSVLRRTYAVGAQEAFARRVVTEMGFDFRRGRLDVTAHPFCAMIGTDDCRLTTRYDERFFNSAFFGTLHEAGHGLYEQGLRRDWHGAAPGQIASLGIHESQSRLWENLVGRSHAFWRRYFPMAQSRFPAALGDVEVEDFYFAINDVRPSLVRVEADEATYNLHILIRFELEQALLSGDLAVGELPGAWNDKYRATLGVTPDDDRDGVLQDIHWAAGLFGYFPTYALGNLYAAQLFDRADRELGGIERLVERGEFAPLLEWLREKVHRAGRRLTAAEIVEQATGRPLDSRPLIDHLRRKFAPLYGTN